MSNDEGKIRGAGTEYYAKMDIVDYRKKINTPAKSPEYFAKYHEPMIDRTKKTLGHRLGFWILLVGLQTN